MSPRSQQRVDRRRRALVDEVRNDNEVARPRIYRADSSSAVQRYNKSALDAIKAPIAKYLPLRPFSLLIWFLVGLVPIMGLLLLDANSWRLCHIFGPSAARAFSLVEPGNLMAWLSSVTFGFAVAVMLGTYSVRRHRRDDYRGKFTVWRWAIASAVLISVDATTGIHHFVQKLCEMVFPTPLFGNGHIWWIGIWACFLGVMLVRLVFEMASSRQAIGWAIAAASVYVWSASVELGLVNDTLSVQTAQTSKYAALMLGHHLLLFSLINYAREVVLEAMGLMDSPVVRHAKAKAAKEEKQARLAAIEKATESDSVVEPPPTVLKSTSKKSKTQRTSKAETTRAKSSSKKTESETPIRETPLHEDVDADESSVPSEGPRLRAVAPPQDFNNADTDEHTRADSPTDGCDIDHDLEPRLQIHAASDDNYEEQKLSKADRRRLRKEQRRQKKAA